jgi:defect-in-organelle-trafficking protein DotC
LTVRYPTKAISAGLMAILSGLACGLASGSVLAQASAAAAPSPAAAVPSALQGGRHWTWTPEPDRRPQRLYPQSQPAGTEPEVLQGLKGLSATAAQQAPQAVLSPVREAALRETAQMLGVQAGLGEESRRIMASIEARSSQLDERFRFNELLIGAGVLPPVISEAQDAFAVDGPVMRVAQRIYRIDEPARFVSTAPSWRSWLLVGLAPDLRPSPAVAPSLLPRDEAEIAFWRQVLDDAFAAGVAQARSILELNLSRMERAYVGMRRFFDLHARGMVSKPQVIAADSVIDREDPNTVVVGSTVFRIVKQSDFVEQYQLWKPLGK